MTPTDEPSESDEENESLLGVPFYSSENDARGAGKEAGPFPEESRRSCYLFVVGQRGCQILGNQYPARCRVGGRRIGH
jgi:hypothetical protein